MIVARVRPHASLMPKGDIEIVEWPDSELRQYARSIYNRLLVRTSERKFYLPRVARKIIFRAKLQYFRQLIDSFRPDVIHLSQQLERDAVLLQEAVLRNIPVIQHFRGRPSLMLDPSDIYFFNENRVRGVFTSEFNRREWIKAGLKPELLTLIYPLVARPKSESNDLVTHLNTAEKRLLFVGRLMDEKAPDLVIEAFAQSDLTGWRLQLLGQGPLQASLYSLVRRLGLESKVDFIQHSDSPGAYYEAADIVVLPNFKEVFGRTTVEAMMCGKAVMTSDTGGSVELIDHMSNGIRVAGKDAADWATKIRRLQRDKKLRERLGAQAARSSRRFQNQALHASEVMKAYDSIVPHSG